MMKKIFITFYVFLIFYITGSLFTVQSQEVQTNQANPASQVPSAQYTPPEIPPTPRSKLEIIQYILLPFAIGASIWLILRLEKMERSEAVENKGK